MTGPTKSAVKRVTPVSPKVGSAKRKVKSASPSPSGGKKKKSGKKTKKKAKDKVKAQADIMSPAAMENLYYIAHNAAEALFMRGFSWPGLKSMKKSGAVDSDGGFSERETEDDAEDEEPVEGKKKGKKKKRGKKKKSG